MYKQLPVWLFLLCFLVGCLGAVAFGWVVSSNLKGNPRFGPLGEAAVAVAAFPDTARSTLANLGADPDSTLRVPRTDADLSAFRPLATRAGIHIAGPLVRADQEALQRASGWRILVGGFMIDGEFTHAALALSPKLEVVRLWRLSEQPAAGMKPETRFNKYVHGFEMLRDGSVIFSFIPGVSLQRMDACGRLLWTVGGRFHHAVTLDEREEYLWTLRDDLADDAVVGESLVKMATATGKIVRKITMDDIIAANPLIDILQIRQKDDNWGNGNPRNKPEVWLDDPFHLNDVEPLPAALADRFAGFEPGDLLVSARNLNLVFVLDPDTLRVKWWRSGLWRRQHDPDWQPNGEITVFDNRMSRDYSRIVAITPSAVDTRVVLDGHPLGFYSRIRGEHQLTAAGTLLVASTQQGRAFEVGPDGQLVFELYSTRPGNGEFNYPLSDAIWFPENAFDFDRDISCAN